MLKKTSTLTTEDFKKLPGYPSRERMLRGMVAVIECEQEIPCNPCEVVCPQKGITIGSPITNLPILNGDVCIGCGLCVAGCPGQAIFMVNLAYSKDTALIGFPYEYLPLPQIGQKVKAVNRNGEILGDGIVRKILSNKGTDRTNVVYIEVDMKIGEEVRSIVRG